MDANTKTLANSLKVAGGYAYNNCNKEITKRLKKKLQLEVTIAGAATSKCMYKFNTALN